MIDPATQAEVLRLFFAEHLSQRKISAQFGIHRQTVTALIRRQQVLLERQNKNQRSSLLAPYYNHIEELLRADPGRSAVNILQKLRDRKYLGGLTILKDYLRTRRPASEPKAYLSLEFVPSQAAQVDWGDFGDPFGLGRSFTDLQDVNIQTHAWMDQFANKRTHATTRKIPELHFAQEKPQLLPLANSYDTDEIRHPIVSHQFRVKFDANEHSVPWRLSGRTLTLRGDEKTVRIYLRDKRVCCHTRCWEKGKSIVNKKHEEGLVERKPGAQTSSDIAAVKALGPHGCRYLDFLGAQNRSIRAELLYRQTFS